jgi:hypothetical protein
MEVDDKITKEQFRRFAMSAIDSVVAVSDEIWAYGLPTVVLRFRNSYEVVVGLRDAEAPDDPEAQVEIDALAVTLQRYKRALTDIADSPIGSPVRAIAAKALGDPPKQEEDDDV